MPKIIDFFYLKSWNICIIALTIFTVSACSFGEAISPIMIAAKSGNNDKIQKLIINKVNLDKQSRFGWTALMFASWQGHKDSVALLLDAGANPNILSEPIPSNFETTSGHPPSTALTEAIRNHHIDIANILINAGATITQDSFALAAAEANIDLLNRMLDKGAGINKPSTSSFYASALCAASGNGKVKAVEWLINNGANPNLIALEQTALKNAIEKDHTETVLYLLEHGADANVIFGSIRYSALFIAVTKYTDSDKYIKNLAIIRMLLSHGADRSHKAFKNQHTALDFKKIQRENRLKHIKPKMDSELLKRHTAALAHDDAIIDFLEHFNRKNIEDTLITYSLRLL